MHNNSTLLKNINIQEIADKGMKIYGEIKANYEPKENGRFLAIEVESGDVSLGDTSAEALVKAKGKHPDKFFYVVKIGYDAAETLAEYFLNKTP